MKKFIIKKDPQIKAECHGKYEKYRNLLSTLLKESKQIYYTKYFESNWNNIRNTWKGIKTIISIKNITTTIPQCFYVQQFLEHSDYGDFKNYDKHEYMNSLNCILACIKSRKRSNKTKNLE